MQVKWTKLRPDVHQLWWKQTDLQMGQKGPTYTSLMRSLSTFIIHVSFGRIIMKISGAADTDLIWLPCKMLCERSRAAANSDQQTWSTVKKHATLLSAHKKWKVRSNSETNVTACNILSYSTHNNNIPNVSASVNVSHANIQVPCSNSSQILRGIPLSMCQHISHPTTSLHKRCKHSDLATVHSMQPTCFVSLRDNSDIQATYTVLLYKTETYTWKRHAHNGKHTLYSIFDNQWITAHCKPQNYTAFWIKL